MKDKEQSGPAIQIQVLFFGALAGLTGTDRIEISNADDTEHLIEMLLLLYPSLKNETYKIALNQNLIHQKQTLKEGDEIALLAPFAGG